jgi:hypothetical protein
VSALGQGPYAAAQLDGAAKPEPAVAVSGAVRLPSREQLAYLRELLTVTLLVIAFPFLLVQLLTKPHKVLGGAISKSV